MKVTHVYGVETKDMEALLASLEKLLKHKEFDSVVFTGLSGAMVAPILAYRLDKHLVGVRKPNDGSHSVDSIEKAFGEKIGRYIIVDDFICSGTTVQRVLDTIKREDEEAECVAIVAYSPSWSTREMSKFRDTDIPVLKPKD